MFNEQKAAQIAAWFVAKQGGSMSHLKLIKLMYLAERASLKAHGELLTGDRFVSMPHGPVLSLTLDHIDDEAPSAVDGWDSWIGDKENHTVALLRAADRDALDELSDSDIEVLEGVWATFGGMGKYQIRDYTHDRVNCPEWEDPDGSSLPIAYETVFKALGFDDEAAAEMDRRFREHSRVENALAR